MTTETLERGKVVEVAPLKLPKPVGFKVLCAVPSIDEKFDGTNLIKPDLQKKIEEHSTVVLYVLAMGPEAYTDTNKFPDGPWCKVGDFVLVRAYTGTRFKVNGQEFRVIYDDHVEAIVDDPRGITRAG